MDALSPARLAEIERRLGQAMAERFALDLSALVLDMTNFATFIDSANEKAPIAQRGKAKQKRHDLRLGGLALVGARDGGDPGGSPPLRRAPRLAPPPRQAPAPAAGPGGRAARGDPPPPPQPGRSRDQENPRSALGVPGLAGPPPRPAPSQPAPVLAHRQPGPPRPG